MRNLALRYLGLLAISGTVVALDQATKSLLRSRLALGESWPTDGWLLAIFKLVRTENSGAAFSMGRGLGPLFLLLAVAAALAMIFYYQHLPPGEPLLQVSVGLLLGGTLGNLIDRLTVGQVTDFLSIRYFAIVNIADISLTFGVIGVMLWSLIQTSHEKGRLENQ